MGIEANEGFSEWLLPSPLEGMDSSHGETKKASTILGMYV